MDNNKPYNEFDEQFNDLPLPSEEQSWQKMEQMLDEDDRNRKPLVPFFLKSCAGWGLALLLIVAATWFILKPQRWWQHNETGTSTVKEPANNRLNPGGTERSVPVENEGLNPGNPTVGKKPETSTDADSTSAANETVSQSNANNVVTTASSSAASTEKSVPGNNKDAYTTTSTQAGPGTHLAGQKNAGSQPPVASARNNPPSKNKGVPVNGAGVVGSTEILTQRDQTGDKPAITSTPARKNELLLTDSLVEIALTRKSDSLSEQRPTPTDSTATIQKKENKSKKAKLVVSAGVGLQQQIPMGGQKAVPYDYYGRSGSLSDYIPSVYLRVGKEKKWFIQGEFRYGAPQTLKDFQYSKQTVVDTQVMRVTTYRLKKTYYHQLPFSFNYYVLPNLTVGVGGIYNHFYGAVTEKEVKTTDLQTQVETMSREIVNIQHFNDSFLYKTQVHALVQTEYHWKRFDFGLRYTKDIQPYIKYTEPDGKIDVKKNQTFQFLVRFRIWQYGRKINE